MLKFKAIIFDLGGVIVNLDTERTINGFKNLNLNFTELNQTLPVFNLFETGSITSEVFVQTIKAELKGNASDGEIIKAWNSMILSVSADSIQTLKELRKKYKLFILSNTNELHIQEFKRIFEKDHPNEIWENLFDKIYYSHQIKQRKPNAEAWLHILNDNNLDPNETIFIDDTSIHFKAASSIGIKSILTNKPIGKWLEEAVLNLENL